MRDKIFISHATPDDNEFSIWLASRLQLLGYKVWIDKESLLGGERFWENIDTAIRNDSIKFVLVYSKNIFQRNEAGELIAGKLKDGVYKEFSFAESIGKQENINDFITLLNIDGADFNLFIGADRLNQIPFYENWAVGLEQLVKKLEKDLVPKFEETRDSAFGDWYENEMTTKNGIVNKKELYYSNWWALKKLPDSFFIYQFQSEKQAKLIYSKESRFPISKISNCLASFDEEIDLIVEHEGEPLQIVPTGKFSIKITDILLGFQSVNFPTHRDSENHLKILLKRIFHLMMKNRKMFWHEMANKRLAYYHTPASLNTLKVKFKYPFRGQKAKPITRNLLGTYQYNFHWHYAISAKPILTPIVGFSLKNHLTFSDDGFTSWEDKDKVHSHRRKKAKDSKYFNESWRDFQSAFLNSLCNADGNIEIPLNKDFILSMGVWTEMFWADFGFYEPYDKDRQGLLNDFYEDDIEDAELVDDLEDIEQDSVTND